MSFDQGGTLWLTAGEDCMSSPPGSTFVYTVSVEDGALSQQSEIDFSTLPGSAFGFRFRPHATAPDGTLLGIAVECLNLMGFVLITVDRNTGATTFRGSIPFGEFYESIT